MDKILPDWLILWTWEALLGEIYTDIRAIALSFSDNKDLVIRYYLAHKPNEDDYESIEIVSTNILAKTSSNNEIKSINTECFFSKEPIGRLCKLDELVYARRE